MATTAHCAYCFECLTSSLDKRRSLNLKEVEALWEKYKAVSAEEEEEEPESVEEEDDGGDQDEGMEDASPPGPEPQAPSALFRPAAISRLVAPSPSSSCSPLSTPSRASSAASHPADSSGSSATSKSSSRTSLFSIGSRIRSRKDHSAAGTSTAFDYPLFVTWNTLSRSGHKSLRGCIGTFDPQELDDGLRSYALTSAFDDSRFLPIAARELPSLECGVTLLTEFEPAASPLAWELGKHGIRVSFTWHARRYGATYLPDVPREQGWTKEETMVSLMRKAGWNGRREDWRKVGDLSVVRYQGRKVTLGYRQWRDWRDWVEGQEGVAGGS